MPMNCWAGTFPFALGEHTPPLFAQPASGSGNTRPSVWYDASLVATGVAAAGAEITNMHTAAIATIRANWRIKRDPRLGKRLLKGVLLDARATVRRFPRA